MFLRAAVSLFRSVLSLTEKEKEEKKEKGKKKKRKRKAISSTLMYNHIYIYTYICVSHKVERKGVSLASRRATWLYRYLV